MAKAIFVAILLISLVVPFRAQSFLLEELLSLQHSSLERRRQEIPQDTSLPETPVEISPRQDIRDSPRIFSQNVSIEDYSFVPGEIIVGFKEQNVEATTQNELTRVKQIAESSGFTLKAYLKETEVALLTIKENQSLGEVMQKLRDDPNVAYVEPNYKQYLAAINTDDTYQGLLWGLDNTGQEVNGVIGILDADIDAPEAWALNEGNGNIIVAVLDVGVAYNHPDVAANMWDGSQNAKQKTEIHWVDASMGMIL